VLRIVRFVSLSVLLPALACTSLRDDLQRAEQAFAEARYEDVEVWLADLQPSLTQMAASERARYYYLAGMSAYRIGARGRARHLLSLCRAELESPHVELPSSWQQHLTSALDDVR
jgi:hypothetical protein